MPRPWQGKNRHRLRRELPFQSRQSRVQRVSVDIRVVPATATLILTNYAPTVSTPRVVVPTTRALNLALFAPAVLAPRLVTPGIKALTLTSFAPTVTATNTQQVPGGGAAGPRYVVSRPIQRLSVRQRIEPRPVRRVPIARHLQLRAHRPTVRLSAHRTVVPRHARLRLRPMVVEALTTTNQLLIPQTASIVFVSGDFWELNREVLLAELDPDLVEV